VSFILDGFMLRQSEYAAAAPAAALKINRVKPVEAATVTSLQRNTRDWLNDYLACLNRLVEAAESIESTST
jgi:hypothetical protein